MSSIGQPMQPFERSELRFFGSFMLGAPSAVSIDARHTAHIVALEEGRTSLPSSDLRRWTGDILGSGKWF